MRIASTFIIVSSRACASVALADEHHDMDRALEDNLRAEVKQSPDLAYSEHHIHIHAHRGVVTLDGHVKTEQQRQEMESLARNTTGVVAVKDELKTSIPGGEERSVRIPVYATAPPVVEPPPAVVTRPAPVIVPSYPNLKVQAWTEEDEPAADAVADQLQEQNVPASWLQNLNITVSHGDVTLRGFVDTHEQREMILSAVQRVVGIRAIYDQLVVR